MDRGAWRATVLGVADSWSRLKELGTRARAHWWFRCPQSANCRSCFNSGHLWFVLLKPPWQHFVVIQILKLDFMGLERPPCPVPLSADTNCCLKVMANDKMASFSIVSGLTNTSLNLSPPPSQNYTECWLSALPASRHPILVNLALFLNHPCILFHSPMQEGSSWVLRAYSFITGKGKGRWGVVPLGDAGVLS